MSLWNLAAASTDASAISAEVDRPMLAAHKGARLRIGEATTTGNAWRGP
jgi:hypothetical protein